MIYKGLCFCFLMSDKKKVLLFDYDGTIVDSLDVAFRAYNTIAEKYGLKRFKKKEDFVRLYDNNFYQSLIEIGLDSDNLQVYNHDLRDTFIFCGYGPKLFPGIKRVVNKLFENCEIIIVTSNITATIEKSVKEAGIKVNDIIGGDKEISKVKKILEIKKRFPSSEIYYIGDTKGDISEGQNAGVKTVGVTWGYHSRKDLEKVEPDFIVDRADELLKIFI